MRRKMIIGAVLVAVILVLAGYFTKGILAPRVGICISGADAEADKQMETALRGDLVLSGFTVLSRNSENDQEKQTLQVKELLENDVDVLVVQPVDPTDVSEILLLARDVPVVFIGEEPENLGNAIFVGCDRTQPGRMQAKLVDQMFAKADINGDRRVCYMLLTGPTEQIAVQQYLETAKEGLENSAAILLEEYSCQGTSVSASEICKQVFSQYGRDVELILCSSGEIALGAVAAVRENGRTPGRDVVIFGVGTADSCREAVRTGALTGMIIEDTEMIYEKILQTVKLLSNNGEVNQKNYISYKVLTAENVDE